MIEGSCTNLATVHTDLKHAQMATDVLEQHDLYCHLHPRKTNSNEVSRRIIKARGLSFRIAHRTELYLSLVGKNCRFFVPSLGHICQYVRRSGRKFANLKPCSFLICKIGYFSMIEGRGTDFSAVYTVLTLEKMVSAVLEQ